ncbi:S41 family peptidase [Paenibacillus segetis]|uniref:PDZ domain-containing protein n=1 Tax=Paenibacillus segetis TaxID=1325360 RepID=A0ABQ1YSS7_9BACL|nr:S41 family peptidase [Paenibacillus segetis]GGH34780.1 hypothetical protein GCM10008013_40750 [Paenibacillus segetis]
MFLKKIRFGALITILSVSLIGLPHVAGAMTVTTTDSTELSVTTQASDLAIIQEVLDYLNAYNIEGVDREEFIENAIRGMVYTLDDPYSDYFTNEEMQDFMNGMNQQYVGIGITHRFMNNKLYITDVLAGSPAQQAGLRQNDIIVKADGHTITSSEDIMLIQGEENTKVVITVNRNGKILDFPIRRSQFVLPSVHSRYISSGKIGYIAISSFSESVDKEFVAALTKLRSAGMKSLVLDLRDNLGGYVNSASNIAKHFIKNGTLMYTADQSNQLEPVLITDGEDIGIPVVVLTNELTASASEILTGALRDNGVATVVGAQTYGKARIQNLYSLSNGSTLKLTVQRYLTPNQMDFNHIGLKPDIEVINNYAAQLVTGFYKAGIQQLEVNGSPSSLSINGVSFSGYIDIIQSGNKIYAPSRLLSSLVRGNVSWSKENQKVIITDSNGIKSGFAKANSSIKIVNNETYIELHDFQKKFPSVEWSYKQGVVHLANK